MSISHVIIFVVIGVYANDDGIPRVPAGIGYLPIEEIIRKANLTRLVNETTAQATTVKPKEPKRYEAKDKSHHATIKVIMKGSDDQVKKIPYDRLMKNMHLIDKVNLPMNRKRLVWNIIKAHKPIEMMRRSHLKRMRKFLFDIPENDFILVNVTDWNVVKYLGVSKIISRRQAGIIGYTLKHAWGKDLIQNPFFINKMKGLICGFSLADLQSISPEVFTRIEESVLSSVWACTEQQLKILLNTALKPHAHGPLEVWTNETVHQVGLLMALLQPNDFKKLNAMAFKGLTNNIVEMMSAEQVDHFDQEQISYLDEQALMALMGKVSSINADNGKVVTKTLDLIIVIWIVLFMKSV